MSIIINQPAPTGITIRGDDGAFAEVAIQAGAFIRFSALKEGSTYMTPDTAKLYADAILRMAKSVS